MNSKRPDKPKTSKSRARKAAAKGKAKLKATSASEVTMADVEPTEVRGPLPAPLPPQPPRQGRSTEYVPELAQEILELLADGLTLNSICRNDERFPSPRTLRRWALDPQHPFAPLYARAREIGYHSIGDDLFEQADDGRNDWMERNAPDNPGWVANGEHIQRSRLRVETRKWFLSKALPKIYGDKLEVDTPVDGGLAQATAKAAAITTAAIAALVERNR